VGVRGQRVPGNRPAADRRRPRLYAALLEGCLARISHAVAGMTLPNEASVGLHRAMGFEPVGTYRRSLETRHLARLA